MYSLVGCAPSVKPHTIVPDRIEGATIAILPVMHDDQFVFEYANDQLESLNLLAPGPFGTALSAMAGATRRSSFNEEFSLVVGDYARVTQDLLVAAIEDAGYRVHRSDIALGGRRKGGFFQTVPESVFDDSDAVLESSLDLGFVASGRGQPYRPTVWLSLRLWSEDNTILMQDRIMFNALTSDDGAVIALQGIRLHVPDHLQFADRQAVLESDLADDALRFGLKAATREVKMLLAGPWQ